MSGFESLKDRVINAAKYPVAGAIAAGLWGGSLFLAHQWEEDDNEYFKRDIESIYQVTWLMKRLMPMRPL